MLAAVAYALLAAASLGAPAWGITEGSEGSSGVRAGRRTAALPAFFVENRGQTAPEVRFYLKGATSVFFTDRGVVFERSVAHDEGRGWAAAGRASLPPPDRIRSVVYKLDFVGGNDVRPEGGKPLPVKVNHLVGADPTAWRAGLSTFDRILYPALYGSSSRSSSAGRDRDGTIDLAYRVDSGRLKYEFVVHPGADPALIRLAYTGVENMRVDAGGDLVLRTGLGEMRDGKPFAYQEIGRRRVPVDARFELLPSSAGRLVYGFAVAAYDARRPLVIDPGLEYSTLLGGASTEEAMDVATDAAGHAYVTGFTLSTDFPTTTGAFDTSFNGTVSAGNRDAFVTKLDPSGSGVVWSTFLGGTYSDQGNALSVDDAGNVYLVGRTASGDFPTTPGAFQRTLQGYEGLTANIFVTKLDSSGSSLLYSTLIGGQGDIRYYLGWTADIVVDGDGQAYVAGWTGDTDFPTTPGAFDTTFDGGTQAFVTKLTSDGTALVYSTFLGSGFGRAIAIDSSSSAYAAGWTSSPDFPVTPGAFDASFNTAPDAFVTKLSPDGTALAYSTFLGAEHNDAAYAIAVNASGEAYVTGETQSALFPVTPGALAEISGGFVDGFLTILSASGASVLYSTYFGGDDVDTPDALALDDAGNTYLAGWTGSWNFPTTPGAFDRIFHGFEDAFVAKIHPGGLGAADLVYSTLLGGPVTDEGRGVAVDPAGAVYVAGSTWSVNFPTTPGALKTSHAPYDGDAFVTKLVPEAGGGEICNGGGDEDGDSFTDCEDPECCFAPACWGATGCPSLTADLSVRRAALENISISGGVTAVLTSAGLETVAITTGPFAAQGFFRGEWQATVDGIAHAGTWAGAVFRKPKESRLTLLGALSGGMKGTIRGYLTESQEGSGVYDRYSATWDVVRVEDAGAALRLEVEGDLTTVETADFPDVALSVLQTGLEAASSGDYVGTLHTQVTHVAVASPENPYVGEGFSYLSYGSDAGSGEAWTHDERTAPGRWSVTGFVSAPLEGVVSGVLDERTLPRTLTVSLERAALPPLADVEVRVVGPRLVSPGQTVDYAIEYRNDGVLTADGVIVTAELPNWAQYVSSTGGGVYRWDTHEAIWKLGAIPPHARGVLAVRLWFFWELPGGVSQPMLAMYESAHPETEKDYYLTPGRPPMFDYASYLAYAPLTQQSYETMNATTFAAELAADPDLAALYQYAVGTGLEFLVAAKMAVSDGSVVTNALLADPGGGGVFLTRVDGISLLVRQLPTGLSLFDGTGGVTWDAVSGEVEQWGEWAVPGSPTLSDCMVNCLIKKLPRLVLKQLSKKLSLLFKSWTCLKCFVGRNEYTCIKCLAGIGDAAPFFAEAMEIAECKDCCDKDPDCGKCTEDKLECGGYFGTFGDIDAAYRWKCDKESGTYEPFAEEESCGYTYQSVCREGVLVPAKVKAVCRNGRCVDPPNPLACGTGSFCDPFGSETCEAKDPNAKHGPTGVVSAGQLLEYEVELENVGTGMAYGVYVTDVLDSDLDDTTLAIGPVVSAQDGALIAPPGEYDPTTRTITWLVGEVGPGEGGHATLGVQVRADAPRGTEIVNWATVYFPSVPEVTPTNPVVSIIPLEDCGNGVDDDGDSLTDCDDPDCDGACPEADHCADLRDNDRDGATDCADADCPPCPEECTNGIDDDGDGAGDCADVQCCGDPSCPTCGERMSYAKGISQVSFRPKGKSTMTVQQCIDETMCAALHAGAEDLTLALNACTGVTIPAARLKANRKRTIFKARSVRKEMPAYALTLDCAKRRMRVSVKTPTLDRCLGTPCQYAAGDTCPVETCLTIGTGMRLCAPGEFACGWKRNGALARLKHKSPTACLPPK